MTRDNREPLDNSDLPGRHRAFHVDVVSERADGLVYSSDGTHVVIKEGMDPALEAIAGNQAAVLDFDIDAEDLRSDAETAELFAKIQRDIVSDQIEQIMHESGGL